LFPYRIRHYFSITAVSTRTNREVLERERRRDVRHQRASSCVCGSIARLIRSAGGRDIGQPAALDAEVHRHEVEGERVQWHEAHKQAEQEQRLQLLGCVAVQGM
jgi:hypothetical protein